MKIYLARNNANNEVVFETTNEGRKVFKVWFPLSGTIDGIDIYPSGNRTISDIVRELRGVFQNPDLNGFWEMPGEVIEDENFLDEYEGEIYFVCEVE